MKLKIKKPKFSVSILSLRYLYIIVIILAIIALGYLGYFLYETLYKTIAQTEQIILLKKEVAPDTIDVERVDNILEKIDQKIEPKDGTNLEELNNPFAFDQDLIPVSEISNQEESGSEQ